MSEATLFTFYVTVCLALLRGCKSTLKLFSSLMMWRVQYFFDLPLRCTYPKRTPPPYPFDACCCDIACVAAVDDDGIHVGISCDIQHHMSDELLIRFHVIYSILHICPR